MGLELRRAGLLLWLVLICGAQERFQVDVNLINVAFTVRDASGALVGDLTKDDVEVFEDSVPQNVAFFARSSDLPLSLGLVMDFSGSQEDFIREHHRDLKTFLDSVLGPRDRAFLLCFGNQLRLVSDFSQDGEGLVDALRSFERGRRGFPRLGPPDERQLGTAFYDAVYHSVVDKLAGTEGSRRALLVFSDGEDNSSAHHMMDAVEAAQAADVPLFCIRYTQSEDGRLNARNKYGIRVMDRLARESGGAHFDAEKENLRAHFRRIGEELHSSYELGYHSANPARDGTFRKIVIRAKQPGLNVRAKTGYFAR